MRQINKGELFYLLKKLSESELDHVFKEFNFLEQVIRKDIKKFMLIIYFWVDKFGYTSFGIIDFGKMKKYIVITVVLRKKKSNSFENIRQLWDKDDDMKPDYIFKKRFRRRSKCRWAT